MSRPAPNLNDATPEEHFLAAIANPWRRELLVYCVTPRSQREVFREFVCAGKKQRYTGLQGLVQNGWLHGYSDVHRLEVYRLNPIGPILLSQLIGVTFGQGWDRIDDDGMPSAVSEYEACDAAIAALRRGSCRRIVSMLSGGPVHIKELREFAGVAPRDFNVSCTILKTAHTIREDGRFVSLTGAGLPGLEGWLNRISVIPERSAGAQASEVAA